MPRTSTPCILVTLAHRFITTKTWGGWALSLLRKRNEALAALYTEEGRGKWRKTQFVFLCIKNSPLGGTSIRETRGANWTMFALSIPCLYRTRPISRSSSTSATMKILAVLPSNSIWTTRRWSISWTDGRVMTPFLPVMKSTTMRRKKRQVAASTDGRTGPSGLRRTRVRSLTSNDVW